MTSEIIEYINGNYFGSGDLLDGAYMANLFISSSGCFFTSYIKFHECPRARYRSGWIFTMLTLMVRLKPTGDR